MIQKDIAVLEGHHREESYPRFALRGVWPPKGRLTRNPVVWKCYLAWTVYSYLWLHRWWMRSREGWRERLLDLIRGRYPDHMSHRSDFTDLEVGALYTGRLEGWSAKAFDQFLRNIGEADCESSFLHHR